MELQLPKDGCNDLRDIPKTKAVGINLRMGTLTKRLWFEIGNDEETRSDSIFCARVSMTGVTPLNGVTFYSMLNRHLRFMGFSG